MGFFDGGNDGSILDRMFPGAMAPIAGLEVMRLADDKAQLEREKLALARAQMQRAEFRAQDDKFMQDIGTW